VLQRADSINAVISGGSAQNYFSFSGTFSANKHVGWFVTLCIMSVTGTTCMVNGSDRRQRSNSPSCLSAARAIDSHTAGVALPKLVAAASTSSVRKSACLGGQSLATSAAKRLLARPACRGGRMMPERPAPTCPPKKKPKPKHSAPKVIADENVADSKRVQRSLLLRQSTPVSSAQNASTPFVSANTRPSVAGSVQSAPLPRIVIKLHQGKIVSPPDLVLPSAHAVGTKKQRTESPGSSSVQEHQSSDSGTQHSERSDRMKAQGSSSKPAKPAVSSKLNPKIASQTPASSKVLADKNSNVTPYFDSSQMQESGSFDKLSLDCCMKLYSQLRDQQKASQPSQSTSEIKSSKHQSKQHRRFPSDRAVHPSESKKRSLDRTQQSSSVSEPLAKVQAVSSSSDKTKLLASNPANCRVELNRIRSMSDTRTAFRKVSDDDVCRVKGNVSEKSVCGEKRHLDNDVCDFSYDGSHNASSDCRSAALSCAALADVSVQQNSIPTATETVPGSSAPLSEPSQSFSEKSRTPTENDPTTSSLPYKVCAVEVSQLNSSEKTRADSLYTAPNHSTKDRCTIPAADMLLPGIGSVNSQSVACDVADTDKLRSRRVEISTDSARTRDSNVQHTKNSTCELADSRNPDNRSSGAFIGQKRCSSVENVISLDDAISTPGIAKQSGLFPLPYSQLTVVPPASAVVDETLGANPINSSLSLTTTSIADVTVCKISNFTDLSDSKPLSSSVGWTSPNRSPDSSQTSEASSSPLRLRIRRLPNISPVEEIYNIIGQEADSGLTSCTPCGTSVRFVQ